MKTKFFLISLLLFVSLSYADAQPWEHCGPWGPPPAPFHHDPYWFGPSCGPVSVVGDILGIIAAGATTATVLSTAMQPQVIVHETIREVPVQTIQQSSANVSTTSSSANRPLNISSNIITAKADTIIVNGRMYVSINTQ